MRFEQLLIALMLCAGSVHGAEDVIRLPPDLVTVDDGRATIHQLFSSYGSLLEKGWQLDIISHSQPADTRFAAPIIALHSALKGPAIWIISGIHGEEPAGPIAIAEVIDDIAKLGEQRPVVLIPMANPQGYVRNWRYLNSPIWTDEIEAQSVGDSSHVLPDPDRPGQARTAIASSPEAGAITHFVFEMMSEFPPQISIDLHEDDMISEGYVYSQGAKGPADPMADEAVRVLSENGIPIKPDGFTRFDEKIVAGIIGPVADSSIDELMSAREIVVDGVRRPGPAAHTVLVFETPASNLPIAQRVEAHKALLRRIVEVISNGEF